MRADADALAAEIAAAQESVDGLSRRADRGLEQARRALRQLPLAKTADDYEALLPWNLHALDLTSDPLI